MIDMLAPKRKPGRRVQTGERFEVSNEMSLVEITAGRRYSSPIDLTAVDVSALKRTQNLLKPPDSTEEFWRQSDLFSEDLDETSGAEANLFGQVGDCLLMWHTLDLLQGE